MSQALEALAGAHELRLDMAAIRRELAALPLAESKARAAELLRDPSEVVARMRLGIFLRAIRGTERSRAARLIASAGLSRGMWDRRIGPVDCHDTLTARQREAMAKAIEA